MSLPDFWAAPGAWEWVDDVPMSDTGPPPNPTADTSPTAEAGSEHATPQDSTESEPQANQQQQEQQEQQRRHYKPRVCRICLETVLPTFHMPPDNLPAMFQGPPTVTYESTDGGRLLKPCRCKGTQKYVHENCLQEWRHADPGYGKRNYYECPTCRYRYRLQRLGAGRLVGSVAAQIVLTLLVMATAVFLLGFVADPIINFCLDPYGVLFSWGDSDDRYYPEDEYDDGDEDSTWLVHFTKGFASLGLLSFFKVLFSSPMQFFYRQTIGGGDGRGGTGRDRLSNMTWMLIVIGAASFVYVS